MQIHHVAFRTTDLRRLERYYVERLGFTVRSRDDARGSVWLNAGGAVLMLERAEPGEPAIARGSGELLAFAVDDKAVDILLGSGLDPTLGARPVRQAVERLVEGPLAEAILLGEFGPGDRVRVSAHGGSVTFRRDTGR